MYSVRDPILPISIALMTISLMFIVTVVRFIRALREKKKVYYLNASGSLLAGLSIIFLYLNQLLPFILLFASTVLVGFVRMTKMLRLAEREYVKLLYEVDSSTPLRVGDIFTSNFWLVMASRWGVWKTLLLFWLFSATIGGGPLFIARLLGIIGMTYVVTITIIASIFPTIILYWAVNYIGINQWS